MAGYAQPDALPLIKMKMGEVQVVEGPGATLTPSNIISDGGTFWLRTEISAEGFIGPPILNLLTAASQLEVQHHLEDIQGGGPAVNLPAAPQAIVGAFPAPPGSIVVSVGPFAAGTAPGADVGLGSWRVLTHIHCTNPGLANFFGGFSEGPVVEVLPAH